MASLKDMTNASLDNDDETLDEARNSEATQASPDDTVSDVAIDELYGRPIMPEFSEDLENAASDDAVEATDEASIWPEQEAESASQDVDGAALDRALFGIENDEEPAENSKYQALFGMSGKLRPEAFAENDQFFTDTDAVEANESFGVLDLPEVETSRDVSRPRQVGSGGFLNEPISNVIPFQFDDPRTEIDSSAITGRQSPAAMPATSSNEDIGALADAVQNALRNVYGADAQSAVSDDSHDDYSLPAPVRQGFSHQSRQSDIWSARDEDLSEGLKPVSAAELDESTTEAVLSYLYNQNDDAPRREKTPTLHALDDLRDAVERNQRGAAYGEAWDQSSDLDVEAAPIGVRGAAAPVEDDASYYRGGALRSPLSRPQTGDAQSPKTSEPYFRGEAGPAPQMSNTRGDFAARTQTAMVASPPPSIADQEKDSGRMLGAAGLGLIGGIALAGILSVFLFNSVVTNSEFNGGSDGGGAFPSPRLGNDVAGSPDKTVARLSGTENAAPVNTASVVSEDFLTASDVSGLASAPIPLIIKVDETYRSENVLVSVKGVPDNARLSAGIDVGGGAWLLPPQRLAGLQLNVAGNTTGAFELETQLMQSDARTPVSPAKRFAVSISSGDKISQQAVQTAFAAMQQTAPNRQPPVTESAAIAAASPRVEPSIAAPTTPAETVSVQRTTPPGGSRTSSDPQKSQQFIRDGNRLMREGDIIGARRLYEEASAFGDPDASLAMGRSYDPSYFEQLQVKTGKPDPAQAFEWYMKALDNGVDTAKVKIDGLRQWLIR